MFNYSRNNKGYSLIVLVITIIVILILAGTSISMLGNSREKTKIMNFKYDIETLEDAVQAFYTSNGTLPVFDTPVDLTALEAEMDANGYSSSVFASQFSSYDDGNYYYIDLAKIGAINLKEEYRGLSASKDADTDYGYIVNANSFRVYVEKGVTYKGNGSTENLYFTLTPTLANDREGYEGTDEDIRVIGNPTTWEKEANLQIVLPSENASKENFDDWTFLWSTGPKTQSQMESGGTAIKSFKYADKISIKSNGVYSIYVKDPDRNVTVLNVNVTKIDDIAPKYTYDSVENTLIINDDETGIKEVYYKTLAEYAQNYSDSSGERENRDSRDFYSIGGLGNSIKNELQSEINKYSTDGTNLANNLQNVMNDCARNLTLYPAGGVGDEAVRESIIDYCETTVEAKSGLKAKIAALKDQFPYIADLNGTEGKSRLVLYAVDYAGNATVIGINETISVSTLVSTYNLTTATAQSTTTNLNNVVAEYNTHKALHTM